VTTLILMLSLVAFFFFRFFRFFRFCYEEQSATKFVGVKQGLNPNYCI